MRHGDLAHLALRALAYAELCAGDVERDGREVFELMNEAIRSSETAVLERVIDVLEGQVPAAQVGSMPTILRGKMHYD